jgi:hypothetical protein
MPVTPTPAVTGIENPLSISAASKGGQRDITGCMSGGVAAG